MKNIQSIAVLLLLLTGFSQGCAQKSYRESLEEFRGEINEHFGNPEESILTKEDLSHFHGLPFFEPSEKWVVQAKFEKITQGKPFRMPTSTDRMPIYKPYGTLSFSIDGREFSLPLYENEAFANSPQYDGSLFLPFTDLTNGEETYGGGRYIDIKIADLDHPVIDFNKCYNPYCAYNDRFSCPIPPLENHLDIRVEAGVKKWHD